ncbi:MAG TPA: hypothetical protein VKA08_00920 [Balneolales bacterium]|nr:hypothetical protein [Balneolales bacterium]
MAKKSDMQSDDALCIKYLMNELDPAEITLVEKKMESDPNFLIEVECMRRTLKRLDSVPTMSPPDMLVDQICVKAAEYRKAVIPIPLVSRIFQDARYASAAAILIIGVSAGSWFIFNSSTSQPETLSDYQFQNTTARVSNTQGAGNEVSPWVDHNNVLNIQAINSNGNTNNAVADSSILKSLHKLRALDNNVGSPSSSPEIELARQKQE